MDKKTYSIGILSLTALILFLANFIATPRLAQATQGIVNSGRDYQVVSSPEQSGGDALYILNNRTGMLAVFTYDAASRRMIPRVVTPITVAFPATTPVPGAANTGTTTPRQR
jgi:hypothetical protein